MCGQMSHKLEYMLVNCTVVIRLLEPYCSLAVVLLHYYVWPRAAEEHVGPEHSQMVGCGEESLVFGMLHLLSLRLSVVELLMMGDE